MLWVFYGRSLYSENYTIHTRVTTKNNFSRHTSYLCLKTQNTDFQWENHHFLFTSFYNKTRTQKRLQKGLLAARLHLCSPNDRLAVRPRQYNWGRKREWMGDKRHGIPKTKPEEVPKGKTDWFMTSVQPRTDWTKPHKIFCQNTDRKVSSG